MPTKAEAIGSDQNGRTSRDLGLNQFPKPTKF
jgi:hypothetical protein